MARKVLKRAESFAVAKWLGENWADLTAKALPIKEICARIEAGTKIQIPNRVVLKALCEDAGLKVGELMPLGKVGAAKELAEAVPEAEGARRVARRVATQVLYLVGEIEALAAAMKAAFPTVKFDFNRDGKIRPDVLRMISGGAKESLFDK